VETSRLCRRAGCTEEELGALLPALERLGAVRVYNRPDPAGSGSADVGECSVLDLGVRSSSPNWSRAQRLREAAIQGLDAVENYATTAGCRRRELLDFFGDDGVIPVDRDQCCDTCRDSSRNACRDSARDASRDGRPEFPASSYAGRRLA
jgi:hypothetical protein